MPQEQAPEYLARVTYRAHGGHERSGTAVLLDGRHLLTCYHVVCHESDPGPVKTVQVALGGRDPRPARVGHCDRERDLALLILTEPVAVACPAWRKPGVPDGGWVTVLGFPEGAFAKSEHRIHHANNRRMQLVGDIEPGASGGTLEFSAHPHFFVGGVVFYKTPNLTGVIAYAPVSEFCEQAGVTLPDVPPNPPPARIYDVQAYKAFVRKETGFIDFGAINVGKDLVFIPIDKLYVPTMTHMASGPLGEGGVPVTLEQALNRNRVALIQGEAGSGKSTFLKRVAYALVRADPEEDLSLAFRGLPLWLRITQLERFLADCPASAKTPWKDDPRIIPRCLAEIAESKKLDLDAAFFERRLDDPESILLLDGLDEGSSDAWRGDLAKLILAVCDRYKCRVAVTMRPEVEREKRVLGEHARLQILDMEDAAVDRFLAAWAANVPTADETSAEAHVQRLKENLASRPHIRRMARNPLMLTILAALTRGHRRLPEERAALYELIVKWLAESRYADSTQVDHLLRRTSELALKMTERETGRYQVSLGKAADDLADSFDGDPEAARCFLVEARAKSGILTERGGELAFWHRSFQEFLAARRLGRGMRERDRVERVWTMIESRQSPEVPRLVAGCMRPDAHDLLGDLFADLIARAAGQGLSARAYSVGILAGMLRDVEPSGYKLPSATRPQYDRLLASVISIFEDPAQAAKVPVRDRLAVSEALAAAGDPRLHSPADPLYWVRIEGGTFRMGAQAKNRQGPNYDPEAYHDEPVSEPIRVTTFEIGKYPVTVQEYQAFLERIDRRREVEWPREKGWEDQQEHPSRPVVLNWEEAGEYCRWAGGRLPTEAEWEFAARGAGLRRYPWGDTTPTAEHANYDETGLGAVCPVGLFPAGATPEGVRDMAGNVWEWTSGFYDEKEGWRAVRGASFRIEARYLRAAVRFFGNIFHVVGFRVVREVSP